MGVLDTISDVAGSVAPEFTSQFASLFKGTPEYVGNDFNEFTFEEILSDASFAPTVIRLVGEWRPHQPFEWGGKQTLIKEYYPGNSEPTVQILGSKQNNVRLKGRFKVKRMKTEDDVTFRKIPSILCDAFDGMRDAGNLIKFSMGDWVRYGFIEETNWKMKTLADIDYEIDCFIIGEDPPTQCKLSSQGFEAPLDLNSELISAATTLEQLGSTPFTGINLGLFASLNILIGSVATALKTVTKFVDTAVSTAEDVQKLANHAIGLIKTAQASISSFKRRVGALNAYFGSDPTAGIIKTWSEPQNAKQAAYVAQLQTATSIPPTPSPAQIAASTATTSSYTPNASTAQQAAAKNPTKSIDQLLAAMLANFTKIAQSVPKARYVVKSGDTLQKISQKFFGNPDHWNAIYKHNQLTTTVLTAGVILEIPKQ
jgi:LysM repeat protein